MSKKDLFGDDMNSGAANEFEQLLNNASATAGRRLKTGDMLKGEILSIGKEEAFVSTGTAVDGALPVRELLGDDKQIKYKVGDIIDVRVVRAREGEILLQRAGSTHAAEGMDSLEDAFDMELPIEGRVTEAVKGGFRVQIMGKSAFCPISQIDSRFVQETAEYIGQKYEFIITQFENGGRNIVVSRRKILDLKRAENEGVFLEQAKPGDILKGKITRLEKFGAFVQLDSGIGAGIEGLIPISELAWGRVNNPGDIVSPGQEVQVALLRMNEEGDRLKVSFSLKQAGGEGDPWMKVPERFPVGTIVEGVIDRKEVYGLFVTLEPGITGLMPRSKWRDHVDGKEFENRKKGERLKVQVSEINFADKKLTLAPPDDEQDISWRAHSAAATKSGAGLGTLGDLLKDFKPTKK